MNRPTPIWFNRRFHEIPTEWALAGSMGAPQKHWDIGCPKIGVSMCIIIFPIFHSDIATIYGAPAIFGQKHVNGHCWHVFSVITGLLVRLKARSEEPKYVLLMRVRSKKDFFLKKLYIVFLTICFGIFLANCRVECVFGPTLAQSQSNWYDFFHQMHSNATFFHETAGAYRQLTILFSHYGKKTCEVGNSTIKTCRY